MRAVDASLWAVVIFPKNKEKGLYSVRLFKTVDLAVAHYGKPARTQYIYASAGELANRLSPQKLKEYLVDITAQFSDESAQYRASEIKQSRRLTIEEDTSAYLVNNGGREALAKGLWAICHLVGDQVHGLPDSKENEDKFKINLDRLQSAEGRAVWEKFNKQSRTFCQGLIDHSELVLEESEVHQLVKNLVKEGKLKTKQDPVLVWKYYAPLLADSGFIIYPGKRHQSDEYKEALNN